MRVPVPAGTFHPSFNESGQTSGIETDFATPSRAGPRHWGHTPSAETRPRPTAHIQATVHTIARNRFNVTLEQHKNPHLPEVHTSVP